MNSLPDPSFPLPFVPQAEQRRQQEFIVRTLLAWSLALCLGTLAILCTALAVTRETKLVPTIVASLGATGFFAALSWSAKRGHALAASYWFCLFYFALGTLLVLRWGALLPQALLLFALSVVSSSLLISNTSGIIFTGATVLALSGITYAQRHGALPVDLSWSGQLGNAGDIGVYGFTFFVLMSTAWLSNREIFRSFQRAQAAEALLTQERDQLEVTVAERTRQLTERQQAEVRQLYQFAYFGKATSSLLHDIVSPVVTVSATLQRLESSHASPELVKRALANMKRIERYVKEAQDQYRNSARRVRFSLSEEISQALDAVRERAASAQVSLVTDLAGGTCFGDPLKLQRVLVNLATNAIDACAATASPTARVTVRLSQVAERHVITVEDTGTGIPEAMLADIFEPFFSTKQTPDRMGIGLAICKEIIEDDFGGSISVSSTEGVGTTFTLSFSDAPEQS